MAQKKKAEGIEATDAEQKRTTHAKERMIAALEKSLGIITNACSLSKIGRTTFYEWMQSDPEFRARVNAIDEIAKDYVEGALFRLIKGAQVPEDKIFVNSKGKKTVVKTVKIYPPDGESVRFYLMTKAKDRGFIKSMEIELPEAITKIAITRRILNSKEDLKKDSSSEAAGQ